MSRLTSKQRAALPAKDFAISGKRFPINDKNHAKAALIDVGRAKGLSSAEKAKIKSRAHGLLDKIGK